MPKREDEIVERFADPGEDVRGAFSAYTAWGLRRRVIGVTDQRFLLISSRYWRLRGRRLLWGDALQQIALRERIPWFLYITPASGQRGNTYLEVRRANGRKVTLNVRQSFIGRHSSGLETLDALFALMPGAARVGAGEDG